MKKPKKRLFGGIRQKVILLILFSLILTMAAYTAVILYQANKLTKLVQETSTAQKQSVTSISQRTMDAILESTLTENARMEAYMSGTLFGNAKDVVNVIADYTEKLFANPDDYPQRTVPLPDKAKDGEISVQLLTEEGVNLSDPAIAGKLGLIGNLADLMTALYKEANVDSCYVALPDGVMLLVDDHSGTKFDENGKIIPIPIRERLWYTGAVENGKLQFTDVTTDLFTGEVSTMCSVPVYQNGKLVAVIGADLFLNDMTKAVESLSRNGSIVCIVNQNGHVVFSPQKEGVFQVQEDDSVQDLRESDNKELASFIRDALAGNTNLEMIEADGETYYMTGAPIETVGWTVLNVIPKSLADKPTKAMEEQYDSIQSDAQEVFRNEIGHAQLTILILIIVVVVLCLVFAILLSKRIVKPLESMTNRVHSLGGDDLQFHMEKAYRTGDEIEVLAESFAMLSEKTLMYISEVAQVTAEKERIGAELTLATRIQANMLPSIYPAFPERTEFDIYAAMDPAKEVGGDFYDFFLVDEDHLCLVMADVSGKGVPAALFMMASKIVIASHAMQGKSPAQILTDVNNAICANNREEMFVTVWLGILELSTGKLIAANAGHEYPVTGSSEGFFELVKDKHGFVIGGMEGVKYKEYELKLEPGSRLFLYTDGVPEATNAESELYGTDRMLSALNAMPNATPEEILKGVRRSVDDFVKDAEQFDDLTMLCVEYRGKNSENEKE